jgi:hypothetical protein
MFSATWEGEGGGRRWDGRRGGEGRGGGGARVRCLIVCVDF